MFKFGKNKNKEPKKKKNGKIAEAIALRIFLNAVPTLIDRWTAWNEQQGTNDTFDVWLLKLIEEANAKK